MHRNGKATTSSHGAFCNPTGYMCQMASIPPNLGVALRRRLRKRDLRRT